MTTPDAGALPPMKPSALPETDALADFLTTFAGWVILDAGAKAKLNEAADRLRALAAATEEPEQCEECGFQAPCYACRVHDIPTPVLQAEIERRNRLVGPHTGAESKLTELERENRELRERCEAFIEATAFLRYVGVIVKISPADHDVARTARDQLKELLAARNGGAT